MNFLEIMPLLNSLCWFLSIIFIIKTSQGQLQYIKSVHDYTKALDKGSRTTNDAILAQLESMEERLSYIHKAFFANRQTVSTKIELLESDIHCINTILGYAPGPMQYESKEDAQRRDANEGMEPGK